MNVLLLGALLFSPQIQTDVVDVQKTIREIDISLSPSVNKSIGKDKTFVYSILAGSCKFLDSDLTAFSPEIQRFAIEVVDPVVKECFIEIEKFNNELNNEQLKTAMLKKIDRILFYPERKDLETIEDGEVICDLQEVFNSGVYTLYKLPQIADDFSGGKYSVFSGGRIDISEEVFKQALEILEKHGYKQENDSIGSSHITTVEPVELSIKNYDAVVSAHTRYTEVSNQVSFKPIGLKIESPQYGRLSRLLTVTVDIEGLDEYRGALGPMKVPPHISIFSQEIKPLPQLEGITIEDFTLEKLSRIIKIYRLNELQKKYNELEDQYYRILEEGRDVKSLLAIREKMKKISDEQKTIYESLQ